MNPADLLGFAAVSSLVHVHHSIHGMLESLQASTVVLTTQMEPLALQVQELECPAAGSLGRVTLSEISHIVKWGRGGTNDGLWH